MFKSLVHTNNIARGQERDAHKSSGFKSNHIVNSEINDGVANYSQEP